MEYDLEIFCSRKSIPIVTSVISIVKKGRKFIARENKSNRSVFRSSIQMKLNVKLLIIITKRKKENAKIDCGKKGPAISAIKGTRVLVSLNAGSYRFVFLKFQGNCFPKIADSQSTLLGPG